MGDPQRTSDVPNIFPQRFALGAPFNYSAMVRNVRRAADVASPSILSVHKTTM